jgi:hypothetical protein
MCGSNELATVGLVRGVLLVRVEIASIRHQLLDYQSQDQAHQHIHSLMRGWLDNLRS